MLRLSQLYFPETLESSAHTTWLVHIEHTTDMIKVAVSWRRGEQLLHHS